MILLLKQATAADYSGNRLIAIIGKSKTSNEFKEFKEAWALDKTYSNTRNGIKVYVNEATGNVESILIAGESMELSGVKYIKYADKLPFGITFADDTNKLISRLGEGEKPLGKNTLAFYKQHIAIEVYYTDQRTGAISFIKFSADTKHKSSAPAPAAKPSVPYKPTQPNSGMSNEEKRKQIERSTFDAPSTTSTSATKPQAGTKQPSIEDKRKQIERTTFTTPPPIATKPKVIDITSPFKKAIITVFNSYKESGFYSIKGDPRYTNNFWNYKYAYNTKVKIPGEAYNMLYSFPFINSELDFVSVIRESDNYDAALEAAYHEWEKKLTANFPASEGWVATCLPGATKTKLSNLEFRNDHYGVVVLNYSTNPRGRHILYLRFLLFS